MADSDRLPLSEAERALLKVLWEQGPVPARDLVSQFEDSDHNWSRSTVLTLLRRLETKGYVASDRSQFAFVYRAAVSREELMHQRVVELASELSDGRPLPLVMAFAEQYSFSEQEIRQFRELVDRLSEQSANGGAP